MFEQYVGDHRLVRDPLGGTRPTHSICPVFRTFRSITTGCALQTLKYIEYDNGERELYDLANDPYELDNQFVNANPTVLAQLEVWAATAAWVRH